MIRSRTLVVASLVVAGAAGLVAAATGSGPAVTEDPAGSAAAAAAAPDAAQETMAGAQARRLLPVETYEPTGMTADEAIEAHRTATEGPEQPIPFNHRFHVREIGMQCAYCHDGVQSSQVAPIPSVDVCMGCHRIVGSQLEPIAELRGYWERQEPIPWERVHKLPDFVQFPHEAHIRNDLACVECHGNVEDMDRVSRVESLKMGWCLECHMGEGQESDFATDRTLVRDYPPPAPPEGRQPVGLYPRAIDQLYGATRGPIDCTACHY